MTKPVTSVALMIPTKRGTFTSTRRSPEFIPAFRDNQGICPRDRGRARSWKTCASARSPSAICSPTPPGCATAGARTSRWIGSLCGQARGLGERCNRREDCCWRSWPSCRWPSSRGTHWRHRFAIESWAAWWRWSRASRWTFRRGAHLQAPGNGGHRLLRATGKGRSRGHRLLAPPGPGEPSSEWTSPGCIEPPTLLDLRRRRARFNGARLWPLLPRCWSTGAPWMATGSWARGPWPFKHESGAPSGPALGFSCGR